MDSGEDYIAFFSGRICHSTMFPQHLSFVNELMSELKIAETTFDVVIHVVDRTRLAVEKFIWKTLVDTKEHEIWRLVDGGVDCCVDKADYLRKPFLPGMLCFCYVTQNVKDTFITTLYFELGE